MTDDYGVRHSGDEDDSAVAWFVGIVVALALLAIGYLVFAAGTAAAPEELSPDHLRCMIAHPGRECHQVTRREPTPPTEV